MLLEVTPPPGPSARKDLPQARPGMCSRAKEGWGGEARTRRGGVGRGGARGRGWRGV